MPSQWIVKRGEKEQGPFTSPQLRQLASAGKLRTTDLIRKDGCEKFVPADKVKGLFEASAESPKPQGTPLAELPVAEVVEVIDEVEPIIILDALDADEGSPEDFVDYEYSYDEYPVADYVEYEAEPSALRRASDQRRSRTSSHESESGRERSPNRSSRKKSKRSKDADDDDGPWQMLFASLFCIALGVGIFLHIGSDGAEISGTGIFAWILMALNKVGGRWAILLFFVFVGIGMFVDAIKKFSQR